MKMRKNVTYREKTDREKTLHASLFRAQGLLLFPKIQKQVAGASFRGPLLIFLLNLTLNTKWASHTSQFALKDYVLLK